MSRKNLEYILILIPMIGCTKYKDFKNHEEIVVNEHYINNLGYLKRFVSGKNTVIQDREISDIEKKKIAKDYIKSRIKNLYYNFKSWMKISMDDLSRCVWG